MGEVAIALRRKLEAAFAPDELDIADESHRHAGHSGAREGGESHFNVRIRSKAFLGLSRVERQRKIHHVLASDLAGPVHALSVNALAPGEP